VQPQAIENHKPTAVQVLFAVKWKVKWYLVGLERDIQKRGRTFWKRLNWEAEYPFVEQDYFNRKILKYYPRDHW